jgi:hypothetical protein
MFSKHFFFKKKKKKTTLPNYTFSMILFKTWKLGRLRSQWIWTRRCLVCRLARLTRWLAELHSKMLGWCMACSCLPWPIFHISTDLYSQAWFWDYLFRLSCGESVEAKRLATALEAWDGVWTIEIMKQSLNKQMMPRKREGCWKPKKVTLIPC